MSVSGLNNIGGNGGLSQEISEGLSDINQNMINSQQFTQLLQNASQNGSIDSQYLGYELQGVQIASGGNGQSQNLNQVMQQAMQDLQNGTINPSQLAQMLQGAIQNGQIDPNALEAELQGAEAANGQGQSQGANGQGQSQGANGQGQSQGANGQGQSQGANGQGASQSSGQLGTNLPPALQQLAPVIEQASQESGAPANMLAAMIWQESRAGTNAGGAGYVQMTADRFAQIQAAHPQLQGMSFSDPNAQIFAAAFWMQDLKGQFGSYDAALRAYNSGPNGVDLSNLNSTPSGTGDPNYVELVDQYANDIANGVSLPA